MIGAVRAALEAARPRRVVCLSTVGAQATQTNLLSQLGMMEAQLGELPMPVAFLRAAWFIENVAWDIGAARASGVVPSFLQPLDRVLPMVATADVGRTAAQMLLDDWRGVRTVELEGPRRLSPDDLAAGLAKALARGVRMAPVPREVWEATFRVQGMRNPLPRMQMLDGFNAGWLRFEADEAHTRKGEVALDTVLEGLVSARPEA
ncbi:NmrA family transcriptional regulator [Burkholderia sp. WAC0059]|uniref:NmrA family transcriptional regulator n=1 Tax=Burkholderia sp. WAC0059 TaxID=2066022 RepID=UPI0015E05F00